MELKFMLKMALTASLMICSCALESPGFFNIYYQVNNYYGSRYKERSSKTVIVNDSPSQIKWAHVFGVDYDGNLWIADKSNHVVKYIGQQVGAVYVVAGTFGTSGYFDGNVVKSLFNKPSGLYIWRSSSHSKIRAQNTKPVLFSDAGANTFACKFATKDNYTLCGGEIITSSRTNNDELTPNQKEKIPDDDTVNAKNVKMIDFTLPSQLTGSDVVGTTYVYVADTGNHCIRRISLRSSHVDTVAGICGTSGFKDGPLDTNLFNSPELVSLDAEGNIFVFDDGNSYVRMIDLTGTVHTLYQGACDLAYNEYPPEIPFDLKLKTLICYKDWKKVYGKPDGHYYSSTTTENFCYDFYLYCEDRPKHPLIRNDTIIEGTF